MFQEYGFIVEKIESGTLRVPIWPLFEKSNFLLFHWRCLDKFIDKFPWGINFKLNFVMMARKV